MSLIHVTPVVAGPNSALVCAVVDIFNKRCVVLAVRGAASMANWRQNAKVHRKVPKLVELPLADNAPPAWSPARLGLAPAAPSAPAGKDDTTSDDDDSDDNDDSCRVHSGFHDAMQGLVAAGLDHHIQRYREEDQEAAQAPLLFVGTSSACRPAGRQTSKGVCLACSGDAVVTPLQCRWCCVPCGLKRGGCWAHHHRSLIGRCHGHPTRA